MRILLKFELDCAPDVAWRAIQRPAVLRQVSSPFIAFTSLERGGFPEEWTEGDHRVLVRALGIADIGTQVISISFPRRRDGVRVMRDSGPALSGPIAVVSRWRHQFALTAAPRGRTLYREELSFTAGVATPLLWIAYWAFWQWRALGLRRLAATWS